MTTLFVQFLKSLLFVWLLDVASSFINPTIASRRTQSSRLSVPMYNMQQYATSLTSLPITTKLCMTSSSSSSETAANVAVPKVGSIVTVECRLIPEGEFVPEPLIDGIVTVSEKDEDNWDKQKQVLTFVLGKGNYLPGLHELILTLSSSEASSSKFVEASLDAGWGSRDPNLEAVISFADFEKQPGFDKSQIKVGVQLLLANGLKCAVTEVSDTTFKIDANPPLAGASYTAKMKLLNVEDAPNEFLGSDGDAGSSKYEVATFALGCFWGAELAYMREPGVVGTKVGYTQGDVEEPAYKQVCSGTTGHTEALMVVYDPDVVTYDRLCHLAMDRLGENKYLLNQVGNDRGTQYRHGVYYHNDKQKEIAESIVKSFGEDCATECLPATKFWDAEDYHQQYLLKGGQSARKNDSSVIRCYG